MKKIYFGFLFLLTVILINSCVSSLYPISDNENDFIFREELLGHWSYKDMQTQLIIKKAADKKVGDKKVGDKKGSVIVQPGKKDTTPPPPPPPVKK